MRHPQIVSHIFLPTHLAAARLGSVGWLLGSSSSPRTRWRRGASHKHTHTQHISTQRTSMQCDAMRQLCPSTPTIFVSSSMSWIDCSLHDRTSKLSLVSGLTEGDSEAVTMAMIILSDKLKDHSISKQQKTDSYPPASLRRQLQDNTQFSWPGTKPIRGNTPRSSVEKVILWHSRSDSSDTKGLRKAALILPLFQPHTSPFHCSPLLLIPQVLSLSPLSSSRRY